MRCPKCGFISFDHLEKCLKCNKNIESTSSGLAGSAYKFKPPNFLRIQPANNEPDVQTDFTGEEKTAEVDTYIDEELDILIDNEETTEEEVGIALAEDQGEDQESGLELKEDELEEEEGEIEIDFSKFKDDDTSESDFFSEVEDGDELEVAGEVEEPASDDEELEPIAQLSPALDIPEELSDISDLAPPAEGAEPVEQPAMAADDSDLSELELDDLDFDLGFDELDARQASKDEIPEEAILALDELDLSETLAETGSGSSKSSGGMDMDEDLDFDLDLGGLSIHKDV